MAETGLARKPSSRLAEIKAKLDDILEADGRNVELAQHMVKSDEALIALGLQDFEMLRVRSWERARKEVAAGLMASADRMTALIKVGEDKGSTINIERAVIQIPAPGVTQQSIRDAVIIDVEPGK